MKTVLRALSLVLVLVAAATAAPAVGKGPTDVAVTGPGVDAHLTYEKPVAGVDMGTLGDASRIFALFGSGRLARSPGLTPAELGPRYVLTWTVLDMDWAVQHAYPFAEGGAWVRFLPGQGKGGWARTPALAEHLVAMGAAAEPHAVVATVRPEAAPVGPAGPDGPLTEAAAGEEAGRTSYDAAWPAALLLLLVVTAGLLIARRRLSR
ncbi:hypothetical protein [Nocardioides antri]|uniref:Uncharacterized protein n=1 Tax=Nocardioides antri TaxID=2607659 RepID=A0A5B1LY89_9ACTN|nr:hypothetical protein [Nocardioides antri]KAA1425623.1 hypothetical protein F0U47_17695 [Nocardioides antri]